MVFGLEKKQGNDTPTDDTPETPASDEEATAQEPTPENEEEDQPVGPAVVIEDGCLVARGVAILSVNTSGNVCTVIGKDRLGRSFNRSLTLDGPVVVTVG
jgi:hypothetical protein